MLGSRSGVVIFMGLLVVAVSLACSDRQKGGADAASTFASFDKFNDDLAVRVTERITGTKDQMPDFRIVAVTAGAYPVGTLLRQEQFIMVSAAVCQPSPGDKELTADPAPTLFPNYEMTQSLAAKMGLDETVFRGLGNAGFRAQQDRSISLSIRDAKIEQWTDFGVKKALEAPACRDALRGKTYRLVRGRVMGTRAFSVGVKRTGGADLGLKSVGSFKAEVGGGGSTISVSDPGPAAFVIVLSDVTVPANSAEAVKVSAPSAAPAASAEGLVYIQQDEQDSAGAGAKAKQVLRDKNLRVASGVEKVSTDKMPSTPEVRYFHAADEAKAAQAADELRKEYPDVKVVPLRVPAPKGQLEVWLAKKR